jgi:RNA polymerase sigma-70 factor (ECF subfamily)
MGDDSDGALVRRCREGDRRAFADLVTRYEKPVYNAALRMLHDREDARDITQAVFLKVYEHLADYDPRYRFYSWIYRIALNESINALHRRKPLAAIDLDEPDDEPGPEEAAGQRQLGERLAAAIMGLSTEYRSVIVLRHFLDCSYEDIATILELPEKTVKSRLFSARQSLRVAMQARGWTRR